MEFDPTECPECHEHERREIDIEPNKNYRDYVYACNVCGHVWTIRVRQEE